MNTERRPHEILGVSPHASAVEIKSAFRRLALKHHPDKDKSEGAAGRFIAIHEAYESVLASATCKHPSIVKESGTCKLCEMQSIVDKMDTAHRYDRTSEWVHQDTMI